MYNQLSLPHVTKAKINGEYKSKTDDRQKSQNNPVHEYVALKTSAGRGEEKDYWLVFNDGRNASARSWNYSLPASYERTCFACVHSCGGRASRSVDASQSNPSIKTLIHCDHKKQSQRIFSIFFVSFLHVFLTILCPVLFVWRITADCTSVTEMILS